MFKVGDKVKLIEAAQESFKTGDKEFEILHIYKSGKRAKLKGLDFDPGVYLDALRLVKARTLKELNQYYSELT